MHFRGTKEPQVLRCTVPSLPLVPASYSVELVIADEDKLVEKVERADRIDVVFRDVFETGRVPNPSQGFVVLPCTVGEGAGIVMRGPSPGQVQADVPNAAISGTRCFS